MNNISNLSQYTVTELNKSIKNIVENSFKIIKVSGEVFQVKNHSSGHIYFSLKDEESTISAICWRSNVSRLNVKIEEGVSIFITGRITTYLPQSKYQLIVEQVEYQGEGALLKILEDRKKKLLNEGLFDEKYKRKLPFLPSVLGIITSESGAVFSDIIHRIKDRFPIKVILFPVNVQGDRSSKEICDGLQYFMGLDKDSYSKPDVIIIARGGGSMEDLMGFNDEALIRKIFSTTIPIISAVGHETDVTLCDFVSDLRAPTPSAAGEIVVPDRKDILIRISDKFSLLNKNLNANLDYKESTFRFISSKLVDPEIRINTFFQNIDFLEQKLRSNLENQVSSKKLSFLQVSEKINFNDIIVSFSGFSDKVSEFTNSLNKSILNFIEKKKIVFQSIKKQINILSYKETLKRGFTVLRKNKKIIKDNNEINLKDVVEIEFYKSTSTLKKIK